MQPCTKHLQHLGSLHIFFRRSFLGHLFPPFCGSRLIIRLFSMKPFPHVTVHGDQSVHSVAMQSNLGPFGLSRFCFIIRFFFRMNRFCSFILRRCSRIILRFFFIAALIPSEFASIPLSSAPSLDGFFSSATKNKVITIHYKNHKIDCTLAKVMPVEGYRTIV